MNSVLKKVVFSLLPVTLLFLLSEIILRTWSLDQPALVGGAQDHPLLDRTFRRPDPELGWSLKPDFNASWPRGTRDASVEYYRVSINSLGLRSPEVKPKRPGEFRILSLGESTTFGIGVDNNLTYSALLEGMLHQASGSDAVSVINAGVPAYSSFQSLKYLKLRGLALKPDLILLYHELNDYLPTTVRDIKVAGLEMVRTDREILDSPLYRTSEWLMRYSAVYRFMTYRFVQARIDRLSGTKEGRPLAHNPLAEIGLPENMRNRAGYLVKPGAGGSQEKIYPLALGRRVSPEERLANLAELFRICGTAGIRLVIIHPSYRHTRRHECILTRFCRDRRVPMLEAHDSLHPEGAATAQPDLFLDDYHPSAAGHERLARDLSRLLLSITPQLAARN